MKAVAALALATIIASPAVAQSYDRNTAAQLDRPVVQNKLHHHRKSASAFARSAPDAVPTNVWHKPVYIFNRPVDIP